MKKLIVAAAAVLAGIAAIAAGVIAYRKYLFC